MKETELSCKMVGAGDRYLIVADGDPVSLTCLETLYAQVGHVIFLDGVGNRYLGHPLLWPEAILGDLDSLWPEARRLYEASGVSMIETPDQNYTDFEKAILYCDAHGAASIAVVNGLGGRTDHALGNVSFLKKYYRAERSLSLYNEKEVIEYCTDCTLSVSGPRGAAFSVLGSPRCAVSSRGLAYDMANLALEWGVRESICNTLVAPMAHVQIEGQALLVRDAKVLLKRTA